MSLVAILDANVLYPATVRDVLLSIADSGLVRPHWTTRIHDEWSRNLLKNNPNIDRQVILSTIQTMDDVFPGALVQGYERWEPLLELPDPDDRHVVAAAIEAEAEFIVTFNLRDFPREELDSYAISTISPDDFLCDILRLGPAKTLTAIKRHRARLKHPPKTAEEYIDALDNAGLSIFASILREDKELI